MAIKIINIDTPTLGDRSYLVHDGKSALVIDPQRDIDRIQSLLETEGLELGGVAETHMHNDYISGGLQLSRDSGAAYIISNEEKTQFNFLPVGEHEVIEIGSFAIRAHRSPGHTFHHISYELLDPTGLVIGLFTGGSILHGSTGRPDLLGMENASKLAALQFSSAHRVTKGLSESIAIYPTHGFGSFCSATPTTGDTSTLGMERRANQVFQLSEEEYVKETLSKLDPYPTYFKYMAPLNMAGTKSDIKFQSLNSLSPQSQTITEIENSISQGEWVVDIRDRGKWCRRHIKGSLSLGLDGSAASYIGWLIPFDESITIISDDEKELKIAKRELMRIGKENVTFAAIDLDHTSGLSTSRVLHFSDLLQLPKLDVILLDVRQNLERASAHIEPSLHIPLHELEARIGELPIEGEIWVHCGSGYRAAAALGILERAERKAALINGLFEEATKVRGLIVVTS